MQVSASTAPPLHTGADTVAVGGFAGDDAVPALPGAELAARLARGENTEFRHHCAGETPWGHLDTSGVANNLPRPYLDRGANGFGVRLLVALAEAAR